MVGVPLSRCTVLVNNATSYWRFRNQSRKSEVIVHLNGPVLEARNPYQDFD